MVSCFKPLALSCALLFASLPLTAGAEIFRWVDAQGKSHFAQDLHSVPAQYRKQAEESVSGRPQDEPENEATIQTYQAPELEDHQWKQVETPVYRKGQFEVPLLATPGGNAFFVRVRLNDELTVPFLLDTGATHVVLTQEVADQLGIVVGPNTQWGAFMTANGRVKQPIVDLESVAAGGAHATDVKASVSSSMSVGLLGTSFLNHFEYSIDPVASVLTLRDRVR